MVITLIGDSVESIGEWAFYSCNSLTSLRLGYGVHSISKEAFRDCSGLVRVVIPQSVRFIGNDAFKDCSSLTALKVDPVSPPRIPEPEDTLSDQTFPPSVTKILVPSSSVNAYKSANGWKNYASIIQSF